MCYTIKTYRCGHHKRELPSDWRHCRCKNRCLGEQRLPQYCNQWFCAKKPYFSDGASEADHIRHVRIGHYFNPITGPSGPRPGARLRQFRSPRRFTSPFVQGTPIPFGDVQNDGLDLPLAFSPRMGNAAFAPSLRFVEVGAEDRRGAINELDREIGEWSSVVRAMEDGGENTGPRIRGSGPFQRRGARSAPSAREPGFDGNTLDDLARRIFQTRSRRQQQENRNGSGSGRAGPTLQVPEIAAVIRMMIDAMELDEAYQRNNN
ncbi:hypothetical protein ABW19_dt0209930 [Dactylella cylindrospora]|nr:hypothetical protein ABW19_dt0209930 [Dactylella cylindrospora]